jgi:hypothetical protein
LPDRTAEGRSEEVLRNAHSGTEEEGKQEKEETNTQRNETHQTALKFHNCCLDCLFFVA